MTSFGDDPHRCKSTCYSNAATAPQIVPNHVYVMLGYNSSSHLFDLYNPWGFSIQLSWAQVVGNFSSWSFDV